MEPLKNFTKKFEFKRSKSRKHDDSADDSSRQPVVQTSNYIRKGMRKR